MYRTEKIYSHLGEDLKYPICVPSYGRPDNGFIKWVQSKNFDIPKDNLFMFVRKTEEQANMYKPLKKYVNIVYIDPDTKDAGDTRRQIVEWGYKKGHDLIFMPDDRVNGIWWLNTVERNGRTFLDVDKRSTPKTAFQIWAKEHLKKGMVATSISSKGFHWMENRVNKPIEPLNGGSGLFSCVALSPKPIIENDANYRPIEETGVEDVYITYALLTHRLPICNLSDICFSLCPYVDVGGNTGTFPNMDRNDRHLKVKKMFWEKTLGLEWGEKHPGFTVVQTKNEPDIIRVNYKYWRKYYNDNTE